MTTSILKQIGFLDENLHYCMDLDLFVRIRLANPIFYRNSKPICFYRIHDMAKTSTQNQAMRNESIEIAKKYSHFLQNQEWKKISNLILYSQYLREYSNGLRDKSIKNLLKTVIELPWESLTDTRFLGLIKRVLFNI